MHKLGGMPQVHLSQELLEEIVRIGLERYPREACGVLLPTPRTDHKSQVVEVPNRSLSAEVEYEMRGQDIKLELSLWGRRASEHEKNAVSVWHTHPAGNVGPSPGDLAKRIEGAAYLVVALDIKSRTGIPTWF